VREDKILVQIDGFLVVSCGFLELALDEVKLRAVIVNVWVFSIPLDGFVEVAVSLFLFAYIVLDSSVANTPQRSLPISRCMLARLM
jgi:hypothetical protein